MSYARRLAAAVIVVFLLLIAWSFWGPLDLLSLLGASGERLVAIWSQPYFSIGSLEITPEFLAKSLLFLLLLTLLSHFVRSVLRNRILVHTSIDPGLRYALEVGAGYFVFVVGVAIGIQSAGVDLTSLTLLGGAIGVGIGFGLQNIVNNFVSGLIILMERPLKVGDRIEIENLTGDVVRIAGRSTWVRTNENVVIIVPNSEFVSNRVTNLTANDRQVRFSIQLGVSYSSDPKQVREVLIRAAQEHPDVLKEPPPDVIFTGFGDSSLDFELRVWTVAQVQTPQILRSDLYFSIFSAFREHGIEIPFPQRDLHLRSVSATIPLETKGYANGQTSQA